MHPHRVPTCIRLLALAYPAITKSRLKNASTLIHVVNIAPKVRLPNSSLSRKGKATQPSAATDTATPLNG
jgi:hypothetical protein